MSNIQSQQHEYLFYSKIFFDRKANWFVIPSSEPEKLYVSVYLTS